jgi:hypothetical protein
MEAVARLAALRATSYGCGGLLLLYDQSVMELIGSMGACWSYE